ncbi:hypothetical protein AAMO2058_000589600 [Amorphochlora amoebiformis]
MSSVLSTVAPAPTPAEEKYEGEGEWEYDEEDFEEDGYMDNFDDNTSKSFRLNARNLTRLVKGEVCGPNSNKVSGPSKGLKVEKKNSSGRMRIESTRGSSFVGMSKSASNQIRMHDKRLVKDSIRNKGKEDRATSEQVMDPRTRLIILKMLNRGLQNINPRIQGPRLARSEAKRREIIREKISTVLPSVHRAHAHHVGVMSLRQLYDFITTEDLGPQGVEGYLDGVRKQIETEIKREENNNSEGRGQDCKDMKSIEENVFKSTELPRSLHNIDDIERHIDAIQTMNTGGDYSLFEENLRRLAVHTGPTPQEEEGKDEKTHMSGEISENEEESGDERQEIKEDAEEKEGYSKFGFVGKKADKVTRKAYKKQIKEAQRARRKLKMKKKDKKRAIKKSSGK